MTCSPMMTPGSSPTESSQDVAFESLPCKKLDWQLAVSIILERERATTAMSTNCGIRCREHLSSLLPLTCWHGAHPPDHSSKLHV
ncbi:hypothetical protein DPMN_013374 [Dreissena polymorpha]|uniref:Uncharacterized protein n=1 Tax=Dreissena polymorpha TaxID=45954 RepID=A0A9D4S2F0_DREPO|nr:hypothetical protein DPMN_013374 [Dreissena polymorpha]